MKVKAAIFQDSALYLYLMDGDFLGEYYEVPQDLVDEFMEIEYRFNKMQDKLARFIANNQMKDEKDDR